MIWYNYTKTSMKAKFHVVKGQLNVAKNTIQLCPELRFGLQLTFTWPKPWACSERESSLPAENVEPCSTVRLTIICYIEGVKETVAQK